jgi:alpha-beta hydrolase superfamily lysophospholipase
MKVRLRVTIGLALVVALTTAAPASAAPRQSKGERANVPGAPGVDLGPPRSAFYQPPKPLPKGPHGSIIWARPIDAPKGAIAYRILYTSTLYTGKRVAVSGFVVAPNGRAPKKGRPVLAWAHGTEGLGRNCAPSVVPNPARELLDYFTYDSTFQQDAGVPGLKRFLEAGYVVVATDYQGLGTPGIPQYTVVGTEIRNVFDSVLAAQRLKPLHAGNRVVALGWSQGGGAAVALGERPGYAKQLRLLGIAGLAPAVNTGPESAGLTPPGPTTPTSPAHATAITLNVYAGFQAAYPELDAADLLTPQGIQAMKGAYAQCINHFAYVLNNNLGSTPGELLFQPDSIPSPPDWQKRFNENTGGLVRNVAPQLIMQGTADTVVNPNGTAQYIQRACAFGEPIQFMTYPGATHQTIPYVAKPEYIPWIADRFKGKPPPSNC